MSDGSVCSVAIITSMGKVNTFLEWEPLSDRLLRARFNSRHCRLSIIQCYAPTSEAEEKEKDDWYEELHRAVSKVPQHDLFLIMEDINAKVDNDKTNCKRAMGRHGCGVMNYNGKHLVDFCLNNNCVTSVTIFQHKTIHKLSWKSPDGSTINQIDHY